MLQVEPLLAGGAWWATEHVVCTLDVLLDSSKKGGQACDIHDSSQAKVGT